MGVWLIWIIAAAVLVVAELLTTTLALALVAVGALAAALTSAVGGDVVLQLCAFVVVSLAGIALIRPWAVQRLWRPRYSWLPAGRSAACCCEARAACWRFCSAQACTFS